MYYQIKPTEMFRERELALMQEAESRSLLLGRRLDAKREPKARSTIAAAVVGSLAALVVAGSMLAASSSPAYAATTPFVVNSTLDWADLNPGDGVCDVTLARPEYRGGDHLAPVAPADHNRAGDHRRLHPARGFPEH